MFLRSHVHLENSLQKNMSFSIMQAIMISCIWLCQCTVWVFLHARVFAWGNHEISGGGAGDDRGMRIILYGLLACYNNSITIVRSLWAPNFLVYLTCTVINAMLWEAQSLSIALDDCLRRTIITTTTTWQWWTFLGQQRRRKRRLRGKGDE